MIVLSLSADLYSLQIELLQPSMAGTVGYALTLAGFANVALGGALKFGLSITETIVSRRSSPASSHS